jgi:hypothetical protein|tara:strand:- start:9128 stop:9283 length:156 start_codon:yes stop_codon:yes gene_type:complete
MIENIINLLEIAKQEKQTGEYTAIALGKNKYPESVREAYNIFRQELWQQKK